MNHVIVFAKAPIPGQVKTRLQPALTENESAELMKGLLDEVLQGLRHEKLQSVYQKLYLACAPHVDHEFFREMQRTYRLECLAQPEGDLGERMEMLSNVLLKNPDDSLLILGSDAPTMPPHFIHDAFHLLRDAPVVLGPSEDGGYYLLGLRGNFSRGYLFHGIAWGSDQVLSQTQKALRNERVSFLLLPKWNDIDRFEDLQKLAEMPVSSVLLKNFLQRLKDSGKLV